MEQYKEKLKNAQRIYIGALLFLSAVYIIILLSKCGVVSIASTAIDEQWQNLWNGFISGAAGGIGGILLLCIFRIRKALKDEKALKILYIQEKDERNQKIWTSARATAMQIFLVGGLVAAIVAGFFNITISLTIFACVFIHSLIGGGCKLYYSRKF